MKRKTAALIFAAAFVLTGCGNIAITSESADVTNRTVAESLVIDIYNYTDTANGNYDTRFSFQSDKDNGELEITCIPREMIEHLVSYIRDMDIPAEYKMTMDDYIEDHEGHTYFGCVTLNYRSSSGNVYLNCNLFDQFPEGFQEYIDTLNELDNENDDVVFGEPIEMTPELFNELTGCSDDKVTDGTAFDVYNAGNWDLYSVMYTYRHFGFYKIEESWADWPITRSKPTEVRNVESTEEELRKYAGEVAAAIGTAPTSIRDDDRGGINILWDEDADHQFHSGVTIYRTCALPDYYEYGETPDYICHAWYLDGGEYRKEDRYFVFYSKDGKFIMLFNEWRAHDKMMEFTVACKDLLETSPG